MTFWLRCSRAFTIFKSSSSSFLFGLKQCEKWQKKSMTLYTTEHTRRKSLTFLLARRWPVRVSGGEHRPRQGKEPRGLADLTSTDGSSMTAFITHNCESENDIQTYQTYASSGRPLGFRSWAASVQLFIKYIGREYINVISSRPRYLTETSDTIPISIVSPSLERSRSSQGNNNDTKHMHIITQK